MTYYWNCSSLIYIEVTEQCHSMSHEEVNQLKVSRIVKIMIYKPI